MSLRLRTSVGACLAMTTLVLACGGTVVFEGSTEGAGGDGGSFDGSPGGTGANGGAISSSATTTDGPANASVGPGSGPANGSVGPGGGVDEGTSVGPGPGPGNGGGGPGPGQGPGPSGGGFDPSGAGGEGTAQGPSGVGGADVGPTSGASATVGGGCTEVVEQTNQFCYAGTFCEDSRLEVECEENGGSPFTCWCYQDGQQIAECQQDGTTLCVVQLSCCESFWVVRR
jgi:hypothetical protein